MGKDVIGNIGGVAHILRILRARFAPDAIDRIAQDMVKFMYFKRTDRNVDENSTEFDMLQQKAEARMLVGSGPPGNFAPVLCMQNATSTKSGRPWFWSVSATLWHFQMYRLRCVACLVRAAMRPDKTFF